jgi:hypothetical protein
MGCTDAKFVRFLRDQPLHVASDTLRRETPRPDEVDAIVVCGLVGGQGTLLANPGWSEVTLWAVLRGCAADL